MDRERLFKKLDIESPEEFQYYENFEALMEEDEHIEEELVKEVLMAAEAELLGNHIDSFFDGFSSNIPDEEKELAIIVDTFRNNISSAVSEDMQDEDLEHLVSEIYKFRNWYVLEHNAVNENSGEEISVRDARYEIMAAKFLGDSIGIDFGRAIISGPDSYEVKIKDIIG